MLNKETMDHYLSLITIERYSVYKTSQSKSTTLTKVVSHWIQRLPTSSHKNVRYQQSGRKGQVTIVACSNAVRQTILPMVIFDANLTMLGRKMESLIPSMMIIAG